MLGVGRESDDPDGAASCAVVVRVDHDQVGAPNHPDWRGRQGELKLVRVTRAARRLPAMRAAVLEDLADEEMTRDKACAAAVRLLDLGCFLIGSDAMPTATRSAHHARTPPRTSLR
jgi:DNA topoisomerase IB